jgi:hypothetical protein
MTTSQGLLESPKQPVAPLVVRSGGETAGRAASCGSVAAVGVAALERQGPAAANLLDN